MTATAAAAETSAAAGRPAATRHLYLVRHAEALADESGLTDRGRWQAELLGRRLRDVPLDAVHHGPLERARQTARLVAGELDDVPVRCDEAAGDYVPYFPSRDELPAKSADRYLTFLEGASAEERRDGPRLAREALERFSGPVAGDTERHELVVTHNFLIGWLVRAAMGARPWRWLGLNNANAAVTMIRYMPDRPATLLLLNDMTHLPTDLRWTGLPREATA
ncbi:histidine phosphatase family protein [Streptomyces sp. NPDC051940]|uniref:histidine phosphatase family protein n=1 Tax=Streptomyces sp. NPDC051940 TaxID=3155675 RepID=UPI00343650B1